MSVEDQGSEQVALMVWELGPCLKVQFCNIVAPETLLQASTTSLFLLSLLVRGLNHMIVQIVSKAPNLDHL